MPSILSIYHIWLSKFENLVGAQAYILLAVHPSLDMHANAININSKKGWISRWLETNSRLVTLTFKDHGLVSWRLRTRWLNCIQLTKNMRFIILHILRKDYHCAHKIASFRLLNYHFYCVLLFRGFDLLLALHSFFFHQGFIPLSFFVKVFNEADVIYFLSRLH